MDIGEVIEEGDRKVIPDWKPERAPERPRIEPEKVPERDREDA